MKYNINDLISQWFNDSKDYALNHYALCSQWLSDYVEHCEQEFLNDFFSVDEIVNNDVETLRQQALNWIAENADELINFEAYRPSCF